MKTGTIKISEIAKNKGILSPNFFLEEMPLVNTFFKEHSVNFKNELVKLKTRSSEQRNITEVLTLKEIKVIRALIERNNVLQKLIEEVSVIKSMVSRGLK